ncbi:MAG: O-sialoglycoprotein endopeptidase, partial [Oscillospiraceae bacterium]
NISSGDVSNSVMQCICKTILSVIKQAKNKYNIANVLMVGGVCSSRYLHKLMENEEGIYFASPSLSTDNAVGICILGKGI